MRLRIVAAVKRALNLHRPGRNLQVFPDDVFILSYPKSGNTWTRFLIANLVNHGVRVDFSNINRLIPDTEGMTKRDLSRLARPRLLKSHEYFDPRYQQVIYIVRDPRDVLLSEYHFDIKREAIAEDLPIEEYAARFVRGENHHPFGSWGEHVASWFYSRHNSPRFLLVRYEALQSDAMQEMVRIADFLGIAADEERLALAIERSSSDRMRELERKQAHLWSSTRETRKDKPFVRKAKSGGWKTDLPPACAEWVESAWGDVMDSLGYERSVTTFAGAEGHARSGSKSR